MIKSLCSLFSWNISKIFMLLWFFTIPLHLNYIFNIIFYYFLGVQNVKKKYLFEPVPKQTQTINAAGSTITYGKRSGKEYIHIPGPINTPLRFMVKKIILKFIIWQSSSEVIPNVLIVFFLVEILPYGPSPRERS